MLLIDIQVVLKWTIKSTYSETAYQMLKNSSKSEYQFHNNKSQFVCHAYIYNKLPQHLPKVNDSFVTWFSTQMTDNHNIDVACCSGLRTFTLNLIGFCTFWVRASLMRQYTHHTKITISSALISAWNEGQPFSDPRYQIANNI
jgi:hypothetical protein